MSLRNSSNFNKIFLLQKNWNLQRKMNQKRKTETKSQYQDHSVHHLAMTRIASVAKPHLTLFTLVKLSGKRNWKKDDNLWNKTNIVNCVWNQSQLTKINHALSNLVTLRTVEKTTTVCYTIAKKPHLQVHIHRKRKMNCQNPQNLNQARNQCQSNLEIIQATIQWPFFSLAWLGFWHQVAKNIWSEFFWTVDQSLVSFIVKSR